MTRKLELVSLRLDVQFQTLLSDVIALTTGVLRPNLVTFQEMLQFKATLHGHFSQLVRLPTYLIVSNIYIGFPNADDARRCEYMSNHDTCQLDVATQPLQPADCPTALILNSIGGVKAYCHFKLLVEFLQSLFGLLKLNILGKY